MAYCIHYHNILTIAADETYVCDCCRNMGHFLWCRKGKPFCERSFALHRQEPENDKQNVDDVAPWKSFCGRPCWEGSKAPICAVHR